MAATGDGTEKAGGQADAGPAPLSPCIGVCVLDPRSGWCRGCLRTTTEVAAWYDADADEKRAILTRLPQRREIFAERRAAETLAAREQARAIADKSH